MRWVAALLFGALCLPSAELGTITVSVVEVGTQLPIAGATATLRKIGADPKDILEGATDASGSYRFVITETGGYIPAARAVGYAERSMLGRYGVYVELEETDAKNPKDHRITFFFYKESSISGRFVDEATGKPIVGLAVRLMDADYQNGKRHFRPSANTVSDAMGAFRIDRLPPGEYFLIIQAPGLQQISAVWQQDYSDEFQPTEQYGRYHWPDTGFAPDSGVRLHSGEAFDAGKVKLSNSILGRVRGRIPSSVCQTGEQFRLALLDKVLSPYIQQGKDLIPCGSPFTIQNIPAEKYALEIWSNGGGLKDGLFASEELIVDVRSDIRTTPQFEKAVKISGQLTCDCKKPGEITDANILFWRVHGDAFPRPQNERAEKLGKFDTWIAMPGDSEIELTVGGSPNFFIKSMQYNGAEVGTAFLLNRNAPEHFVSVTLSDKGAEISGKVSANDSPVEGAHVVLTRWPITIREGYPMYSEVVADANGKYRFRNLAAGKYRIISIGPSAWETRGRPDIINQWIAVAEEIRIEERQVSTVNLECKIL